MTTRVFTVAEPGRPVLRYGEGAQGWDVPAFAVVITPQCPSSPSRFMVEARRPHEHGDDFHRRVCQVAHVQARIAGLPPEYVAVLFTDALPPVEWRDNWQKRSQMRWMLSLYYTPAETKVWACRKLAELSGLVPAGALTKLPQP